MRGAGGDPARCPFLAGSEVFDPFGEDYLRDPAGNLRWSRDDEPVFFSEALGYWVVTRYDDVKAVFRDHDTFSPSIALEKITPTSEEANDVLASYGYAMGRTLVNEDEPAHMPRRRALLDPFLPERLVHHEEMVRRVAREFVDRFIDDGRADLVDQMLWEVPLTVALHFLGVPEEDMPTLHRYSVAHTVNTWGRPAPEQQVAVADAVGRFWQLSGEIVAKLRADPSGDGWMAYGVRQNAVMPEVVTDSYVHSIMMAGLVAAHETTANAAANAIKLLLETPGAWREICDDPSLIPNAVEECLRHSGSIVAWRRLATRDTVVGGVEIPAGGKLLVVTGSANHDEREFDDPDAVDIRRINAGEHLTFGFGSHQCMGKNLARMEMQIILEELTARLPHLALEPDQEFSYLPNTSFRGPEHLLVTWDPDANPERTDSGVLERRQPLHIGEPSSKLVSHRLRVEAHEPVAEGVVRVRLTSATGRPVPAWTPGSHIDLECGELSRQYSLCGSVDDRDALEIAVLEEPESRGGSRWVHHSLHVGSEVVVRGPRNHFRLDPGDSRVVFVAGGIGITPIVSLATAARAAGRAYSIHYAGRSRGSMAFLRRLADEHGDRLHVFAADEGGRLDLAALAATLDAGDRVYACGPTRLLEGLSHVMRDLPPETLKTEHFTSTIGVLDPAKEHPFEIVLRDSGLSLEVPADRTVLQTLRAANIDVQSDCEEGLCGSCEVAVVEGEVDHRDVVLSPAERASNRTMMTCCSRACGTRLELQL
jgi:cytochrome P450/ferredoxin-NADP reductase